MRPYVYFVTILLMLSFRASADTPVQGMWMVRYALSDARQITAVIHLSEQLRLSDLYVQVWAKGQFLMRNSDAAISLADSDGTDKNLSRLINEAHRHGIRIHAWLNVLNVWSGKQLPVTKKHIYYTQKKALLRAAGDHGLPDFKTLQSRGVDGYFIEPLNGSNLHLLKKVLKHLLTNYQIDGIHLDYFRFPGEQILFSPQGRSAYIQKFYFDPVRFFMGEKTKIFSNRQRLFGRQQYLNYQRHNLEKLLKNIKEYIAGIRSHTILSMAVKANLYQARSVYLQDWPAWLRKDLCDYVVLMNYTPDLQQFMNNLQLARRESQPSKIVVGVSTYNQTLISAAAKINHVKGKPFLGYALFSFNDLHKKNDTSMLALFGKQ